MKLFPVTATLYIPILLYISQLYLFQNDIFLETDFHRNHFL